MFLDANVLFSAAYSESSALSRLWQMRQEVMLLSSPYAIEEARRNLDDLRALDRLRDLISEIEVVIDVGAGELPPSLTLPEKDRPIALAALGAHATHLLTGDRAHFGHYFGRTIAGLWIGRPSDYMGEARRGDR